MYSEVSGGGIAGFRGSSATYQPTNRVGQDTASTIISIEASDWAEKAGERLAELLRLRDGWDGHNGKPLNHLTAIFACNLLARIMIRGVPAPQIMPASYGGLQIEWHRRGWDIEIEIEGPNRIRAYSRNVQTGAEDILAISADFSALMPLIARIQD